MRARRQAPARQVAVANVIDAIDECQLHVGALKAVEYLMAPQLAATKEDLSHVERSGLAYLLTIINISFARNLVEAREIAEKAMTLQ